MVAISNYLANGLLLVGQSIYSDVALPQQASLEPFNILHFLAGSAPYLQRTGYGISTSIPDQCTLEQVQMFSRHAERYPSMKSGKKIQKLYKKLSSYEGTLKGSFAFLSDYTFFAASDEYFDYETTPINSDSPFAGTTNAQRHGAAFRARYKSLYSKEQTLPVFSSNSNRVYQTSNNFVRGFFGDEYDDSKVNHVVIDELSSLSFNSLTPRYACSPFHGDNVAKAVSDKVAEYDTSFLTAIKERLNLENQGLTLKDGDIKTLFSWCAYEINVKGTSPVCGLFSNEEFIRYSYGEDLKSYYQNGPGNNYTAAIGSTLLNASLALLTDDSAENKIWLSFSHDSDVEMLHAALGLLLPKKHLPTDHIPFPNPYEHAQIVPQLARIYTEKYKCGDTSYVRYIVNDAVVPFPKCATGPGFACPLKKLDKILRKRIDKSDVRKVCEVPESTSTFPTFYWDYKTTKYNASLGRF